MKNVFDVANSLSSTKTSDWSECETLYEPFMINRFFSNHYDTTLIANEMNSVAASKIPKKWAFDFYKFAIKSKKKRFSAWAKSTSSTDILTVSNYYKCSKQIAEQYLKVLTQADIEELKFKMYRGGRS
jgi:hypothetical protein